MNQATLKLNNASLRAANGPALSLAALIIIVIIRPGGLSG